MRLKFVVSLLSRQVFSLLPLFSCFAALVARSSAVRELCMSIYLSVSVVSLNETFDSYWSLFPLMLQSVSPVLH